MPEKILILGGSRFHGLQLAEHLSAAGDEIYVLNRGNYKACFHGGIKHIVADRNDSGQLKRALEGLCFSAVIDNNAYSPEQIESVLDLIRGKCNHYIFTSTAAVYLALHSDHRLKEEEAIGVIDSPYSPMIKDYALNKFYAEDILRQKDKDFNYTIIRLPNVFGVGDFVGKLCFFYYRFKDGGKVLLEEEVRHFSLVCVQDVVRAVTSIINNEKYFEKTVNVADPIAYSYEEFFSTIFGKLCSPDKVISMPAQDMWDAGYFLPLAWGPLVDTTLFQSLIEDFDFTHLNIWGRPTLEWELGYFGNRGSDPDFVRTRELESKLIASLT
jgi:nucleoside-diphosphate-sugar epimerase